MDSAGLGQQGLAHGNVKRPFKNLFWRTFERFQALIALLQTISTQLTNQYNYWYIGNGYTLLNTISSRIGLPAYVDTSNYFLSRIDANIATISSTLTDINSKLTAVNAAGNSQSVAFWTARTADCLFNSAFPGTGVPTLFSTTSNNLPGIKTDLDKLAACISLNQVHTITP